MLNDIQKSIISKSIQIRIDRGENVVEVFKGYKNLSDADKQELLAPYSLTPYQETLEEAKEMKLAELSKICKEKIENGVTINIDGIQEHFTYGIENGDQGNIDDLFNLVKATGLPQPYHCSGGDCKLYTIEQIYALYIAVKQLKAQETTYYNQLREMILKEYADVGDVKAIEYGAELTGIYLETYESMMAQSELIISALTSAEINK